MRCFSPIPSVGVFVAVLGILSIGCDSDRRTTTADRLRAQERLRSEADEPASQERLLKAARDEVAAGEYQAALVLLQSIDPVPESQLLVAECVAGLGDYSAAVDIVLSIAPEKDAYAVIGRGRAGDWLVQIGELDRAEKIWKALLASPGGDAEAIHRKLAQLLNRQGRRVDAAEHLLSLAVRGRASNEELFWLITLSDPYVDQRTPNSNRQTRFGLGLAKSLRSRGRLNEAMELVEEQRRQDPESTAIAAFQGRVYEELGRDESFQAWLATTPAGIECESEYWSSLGLWERRHGRLDTAIRCFSEALLRDPTDRWSQLALAQALTVIGSDDDAAFALRRHERLQEVSEIADAFGKQELPTARLKRMASLLTELGRPIEGLAWNTLAARQSDSESWLADLDAQRSGWLQPDGTILVQPTDLGFDIQRWPLPLPEPSKPEPINAPDLELINAPESLRVDETKTAWSLVDVATATGLAFTYDNGSSGPQETYLHQMTGGGIGVLDYDLDSWPDLYFSQSAGDAFANNGSSPNVLLRNLKGQRWVNISTDGGVGDRGYGQGVCAADINQDGFPDLVLANIGRNRLLINCGDGTFREQRLPSVRAEGEWTTSIAAGDLNGDGLPELVEINYVDDAAALTTPCRAGKSDCQPRAFQPASDRILELQPDGTFRNVGNEWLEAHRAYGFAGIIADLDGKPGNDLFIANDSNDNQLWSRVGTAGKPFEMHDEAALRGCATGLLGDRQGCMGIATGDFDHNGLLDLHITNFTNQPVDLYLQEHAGLFLNQATKYGLYDASLNEVGFGTQAVDLDHDGQLELIVLNGHVIDLSARGIAFEMRPQLFAGRQGVFALQPPAQLDDPYWNKPALGRTLATLDWNRDGRMDVVANHLDAPAALLENRTPAQNSITVQLVGTETERDATGARVEITCGSQRRTGWLTGGDGFLCSNESIVHLGVGKAKRIDRLQVFWPSGHIDSLESVGVNERVLIVEGQANGFSREAGK